MYTKFHFLLGKIKLIEKSFNLLWDNEMTSFSEKDQYATLELTLRNKKLIFDINFDINASCSWVCEKSSYYEPEYIEQSDVVYDIKINYISSDEDISKDINDFEVYKLLENFIIDSI